VSDWDERMKGGAVRDERSPLKEAMDCEEQHYISLGVSVAR
jgi:hypothetical protein